MTNNARTAQELADERLADCIPETARILEVGSVRKVAMTRAELHQFAANVIAALASQAEPVAEWVRSPVGEFPQLVWERGYEARIGDKLYTTPPAPATCAHEWRDFYTGPNRTHFICAKCEVKKPAEQSEDGRLLDWLRDEACDLRCINVPTGGDDYSVRWQVVSHWQARPHERVEAQSYTEEPRDAIRAAIAATTGKAVE